MADATLTIAIGLESLTASLSRRSGRPVTMTLPFRRNLDTVLIAALDSFLKRNRIDPSSFRAITVRGSVDKFSSVYRIVKAWQQAIQSVSDQS